MQPLLMKTVRCMALHGWYEIYGLQFPDRTSKNVLSIQVSSSSRCKSAAGVMLSNSIKNSSVEDLSVSLSKRPEPGNLILKKLILKKLDLKNSRLRSGRPGRRMTYYLCLNFKEFSAREARRGKSLSLFIGNTKEIRTKPAREARRGIF